MRVRGVVLGLVCICLAATISSASRSAAATCTTAVGPGIAPPASVPTGMPGFHAAWFGQSGYMTLCPGEVRTATVAYYNSGSLGWVAGKLGEAAYLGTAGPEPGQDRASQLGGDGTAGSPNTGWPRYNRLAAQPSPYVGPGQVAWFQFAVKAPATPGTYRIALRPLVEGAQWMEDYGVFWVVTVPAAAGVVTPTPTPVTLPPLAVSIVASSYGYVSAVTTPGALCRAGATLPSGVVSTAPELQLTAIASVSGSVSWTYGTLANTVPGTGTHIVICSYAGQTTQAAAAFSVIASTPTPAPALTLRDIDGRATLLADDGTYLGIVSSNQYQSDSICNSYGTYGSPYASKSVRNKYGTYGGEYASQGAYNPYSSRPPAIVFQGRIVGYLTKNSFKAGAVDPDVLFATYDCVY